MDFKSGAKFGTSEEGQPQYEIDNEANAYFKSLRVEYESTFGNNINANGDINLSEDSNMYFGSNKESYINKFGRARFKSIISDERIEVNGDEESTSMSTGSVVVKGGIGVEKTLSAKQIRIADSVTLEYDESNYCVSFSFA